MKVALIAPTEETVPPTKYGGTEWIVYHLAHGLAQKGHEVDLYAPGDSAVESKYSLIATTEKSLRTRLDIMNDFNLLNKTKMAIYEKVANQISQKNYDIVHNHASWRLLMFKEQIKQSIITTLHSPLSIPTDRAIFKEHKNESYISISNNQRKDLPDLNYIATIYNGTDIHNFPFSLTVSNDSSMSFLARMSHDKGPIEAAQVAAKTNHKIVIAAKVDPSNVEYFEKFKRYINNPHVQFFGEMVFKEKLNLLQQSRCLLVPIQWEEPFGLMFTEAMACGTPVITFSRGSAPEIIIDGKTGFLVNQSEEYIRGNFIIKKTGIEGLSEAVERIYDMSDEEYNQMRINSRKQVEEHFTVEKMVDAYEYVYNKIIDKKTA